MGCHQFPFGFPYVGASFQKRGGQSQGKSVGQLYFFGQDVAVYGVGEITGQECDFAFSGTDKSSSEARSSISSSVFTLCFAAR